MGKVRSGHVPETLMLEVLSWGGGEARDSQIKMPRRQANVPVPDRQLLALVRTSYVARTNSGVGTAVLNKQLASCDPAHRIYEERRVH